MKTSQLIGELAEVIAEYGDLPAYYFDGAFHQEPAVHAALHRTGNSTMIWGKVDPLTDEQAESILSTMSSAEARFVKNLATADRKMMACFLQVRRETLEKAKRVIVMADPGELKPQTLTVDSLLITLRDIRGLCQIRDPLTLEKICRLVADVLDKWGAK